MKVAKYVLACMYILFLLVTAYLGLLTFDNDIFLQCPQDVQKMGVAAYNAECRNIVMRYSQEWEVSVVHSSQLGWGGAPPLRHY